MHPFMARRYVVVMQMFCPQCGQSNVGVNFTSSNRIFRKHSGQVVRFEYVSGRIELDFLITRVCTIHAR